MILGSPEWARDCLVNANDVTTIFVALIAAGAAIVQARRSKAPRSRLHDDVDLLNALPEGSEAKRLMAEHVDAAVNTLLADESRFKREPTGAAIAIILAGLGGLLIWLGNRSGSWWQLMYIPAAFLLLMGIYGFVDSVIKKERTS